MDVFCCVDTLDILADTYMCTVCVTPVFGIEVQMACCCNMHTVPLVSRETQSVETKYCRAGTYCMSGPPMLMLCSLLHAS